MPTYFLITTDLPNFFVASLGRFLGVVLMVLAIYLLVTWQKRKTRQLLQLLGMSKADIRISEKESMLGLPWPILG